MTPYELIFRLGYIPLVETPEADAAALAKAMLSGDVDVMELPYSGKNEKAVREIVSACPEMLCGMTVETAQQCEKALAAGAKFVVARHMDEALLSLCAAQGAAVIPHCADMADVQAAQKAGLSVVEYDYPAHNCDLRQLKELAGAYVDMRFVVTLGASGSAMQEVLPAPFTYAVRGSWAFSAEDAKDTVALRCGETVTAVHDFTFFHLGINMESAQAACQLCDEMHRVFRLSLRDNGPSSRFADNGFEIMKRMYRGEKGHIAMRANNCDRAIVYLKKLGYEMDWDTCYIFNGRIGTIYLKEEHSFGGFAVHLAQKPF